MKQIIVVDKGFVFVGELESDGDFYSLKTGFCIRRWGTTKGLGQLAMEGPLSGTILEPADNTKFPKERLIFTIDCEQDKWK